MKRICIYIPAVAALAAVACTKINEDSLINEEQTYTVISARTETDCSQTRTYLGEKNGSTYPVYWSANDTIALISEDGISKFGLLADASDLTKASFGGDASKIVGKFPKTLIYPAAYPAEGAFAAVNGSAVQIGTILPTIQTLVNNLEGDTRCFDNNTFPMAAAASTATEYQFYNLAGILRLKIYYTPDTNLTNDKAGILRITLKGNNREILSGPVAMQFNPDDGTPVASTESKDNGKSVSSYGNDGKERVIIDLTNCTRMLNGVEKPGLELPATESGALEINLAVIPQTFTNGFTVEIMDASTMGTQVYKTNDPITIKRSEIKEMEAIDFVKPAPLEVANCYIASEPGEIMMPAFAYGNRMGTNLNTLPGFNADNNDVDILWTDIVDESGNKLDAITDIDYMKFADGNNYVSYRLNVDPATGEAYRGNTVLALYDKDTKKIYWTWHIWMCEQPQDVHIDGKCAGGSYSGVYPDGTPYEYEAWATYDHMQILDRNIGAIHALPSECDDDPAGGKKIWQTYGLYYQDGRRDPFIGGDYNGSWAVKDETNYSADAIVKYLHKWETTPFGDGTHKTWTNPMFGEERGWKYVKGNLTIDQTLNCPQKISFDLGGTGQWVDYSLNDNLLWMDPSKNANATHGNTGLLYGGHEAYWNRTKTIFDPCPPGYSVLGERGGYFIGEAGTKQWCGNDTDGYGLMYTYEGTDIWWPAAGFRTIDGCMAGVGKYGFYFFYDHINASHGGHGFGFQLANPSSGSASTSMSAKFLGKDGKPNVDNVLTNHATPIRCVKATQDHGSADLADPKSK